MQTTLGSKVLPGKKNVFIVTSAFVRDGTLALFQDFSGLGIPSITLIFTGT